MKNLNPTNYLIKNSLLILVNLLRPAIFLVKKVAVFAVKLIVLTVIGAILLPKGLAEYSKDVQTIFWAVVVVLSSLPLTYFFSRKKVLPKNEVSVDVSDLGGRKSKRTSNFTADSFRNSASVLPNAAIATTVAQIAFNNSYNMSTGIVPTNGPI